MTRSALVLSWAEAFRAGPGDAGGKGFNLSRLARYGFPVPDGFVLSAGAYRAFVAAPPIARVVRSVADVEAAAVASDDVAARLATVRATIQATPLPPEVVDAVTLTLATNLGCERVAVRSSASGEDGRGASFAGVHASVLDVLGPDAALRAIRDVYASLWTPQAVAYRRRLGLDDDDVACAIVVCRMIDARTGGVAFTCDPRSGRRDVITISAASGAAGAVVSGTVTPEEITVGVTSGGLAIESRAGPRAVDDDQVMTLARLAQRVHDTLGDGQDPQDLEWAIDAAGRVHLLQARPVTHVPRRAMPGSEHLAAIWSTANIKDAAPFVATTMSWSILGPALRAMMWTLPARVGYPVPRGTEVIRRFAGRAYFDVTSFQWLLYDCFGTLPAETNRGMGGHHEPIPVPDAHPLRGRRGWRRILRRLAAVRVLLAAARTVPRDVDAVFRHAREMRSIDVRTLTNAELLARLEEMSAVQRAYGEPFILASSMLTWQSELERLLDTLTPGRGVALAAALVAGTGDVVSAAHGVRLFDLADAARRDTDAQAWLRSDAGDRVAWTDLPETSPFRQELGRFLHDFGHRAVYEAECATPRWNEDPSWLLDQVRMILDGHGRRPDENARERRAVAEREVRRLTWLRRPQVRWLARRAREGAILRERAKSALVAHIEPLRGILLETGRRLVACGFLGSADDVFHLAISDVAAWLRGEWDGSGLDALVADRKAQMAAWMRERPPDVIAEGTPASAPRPQLAMRRAGSTILTGLAVSAGQARGPARIIRHPVEGGRLAQGDVLVAPSTDPAWTPLFLRAAALVTEVGGMLSHGAIVAREYGLPAVVNVPGVLDIVADGRPVTVDGDTGTVTLA